ncbi:MAG TPA: hypothetical protein VFF36_02040, partial [Planctomycetota bacterium]|nr:hypothetical protein [Planctomycetota bacterium]
FDRVADRLRGRGSAADRVIVRLSGGGRETAIEVRPVHATLSSRELVELVRARLARAPIDGPIVGIDVVVDRESELEGEELGLFGADAGRAIAREVHRRTIRGQRGKKGRKRTPAADHATGTLFD